jgi:hypothetical protein
MTLGVHVLDFHSASSACELRPGVRVCRNTGRRVQPSGHKFIPETDFVKSSLGVVGLAGRNERGRRDNSKMAPRSATYAPNRCQSDAIRPLHYLCGTRGQKL